MGDSAAKTFFLIAGFQRTGTSSVAQFLDHLGVYFGDKSRFIDPTKYTHNPIFYELQWILDFNHHVLGTWGLKQVDYVLPIESEFQRPEIIALRETLKQKIRQEFGDHPMAGAKDPRLCFTFPLWQQVLTEMGYDLKIIVTLRSASAIIKSNRELLVGRLSRWQRFFVRHQLAVRYFFRDFPVCYFDYDQLMRDPVTYGQTKAAELGLPIPDPAAAMRHIARERYHHQPDDTGTGDAWVDKIDAELRAGQLDPNEYLKFRSINLLLTEEIRALWQDSPQQWFRQYQQIMEMLGSGGHFVAERKPDGSLDLNRISS